MSGSHFGSGPFGRGAYSDDSVAVRLAPIVAAARMRATGTVDRQADPTMVAAGIVQVSGSVLWQKDTVDCEVWELLAASDCPPGSSAGAMFPNVTNTSWLLLTGGVMTGPLTLAFDPTQPMQAATARYVNNEAPPDGAALPTSSFGLEAGTLWNNGGYLCIA